MRIGVLTGGGDAPGLNGVIRAVVRAATIKYGWSVVGIFDGFEGLLGKTNTKELKPWNTRGILSRGARFSGPRTGGTLLLSRCARREGWRRRTFPAQR